MWNITLTEHVTSIIRADMIFTFNRLDRKKCMSNLIDEDTRLSFKLNLKEKIVQAIKYQIS